MKNSYCNDFVIILLHCFESFDITKLENFETSQKVKVSKTFFCTITKIVFLGF